MHASAFDRYQATDSLIHRLDPRVKLILTVLFIFSNVLIPDGEWVAFALAFVLILALTLLARLPWAYAIKRSFIAIPFALAALPVIVHTSGNVLATIPLGPWTLSPTDAGMIRFFSILVRSLLSVQMAILLTTTTQFPDLMHAMRHLYVPQPLVATISFMYRYLFVLADEAMRLIRARNARSAAIPGQKSGVSVFWRARVAGNMVGQLFVRSFERGDRVYNAMLARGYTGHIYTLNPHVMRSEDWASLLFVSAYLLFIQFVAHTLP
ncbi:MAG: cobalt ECF transporter T component CbiQ [Caldilineales bacterium]|nr:cobalt ECF transporter T component CbiQ [Caldilineales bacterium]